MAKLVKKEQILNGISTNRLSNTIGSLIDCNLKYISFAIDSSSGGTICTIRHDDLGRKLTYSNDSMCLTHAHAGPITDIQYNPYNESVVATSGFDAQIQLWSVHDEARMPLKLNALSTLALNEARSDCVQWNPNVASCLVSTSLNTLYLWDVEQPASYVTTFRNHTEAIQSLSWKRDGSLIVTTAKDKTMQVIDPRNKNTSENLKFESLKTSNKDSKVVWLGTSDCILSSVYTQSFQREINLWDIRNTTAPVHETSIDTGNNVLAPFYDYDTSVLFLIGKAETMVRCGEVFLNDNWNFQLNSTQQVDDQIKGACMLPKFGLDLMKCEIDRFILLTRNSVYPLPYFVPRRSYYDFHSDVYPETYNITEPGCNKNDWLNGVNADAKKTSLNPENQKRFQSSEKLLEAHSSSSSTSASSSSSSSASTTPTSSTSTTTIIVSQPNIVMPEPAPPSVSSVTIKLNKQNSNESDKVAESKSNTEQISEPKPTVTFRTPANNGTNGTNGNHSNGNGVTHSNGHSNGTKSLLVSSSNGSLGDRKTKAKSVYYQSKFKYIDGKPAHKTEHITNIRNLSTMWPSECNGFQVNTKHGAFLLSGTSGQIGILELNKAGRLPDTNMYSIVNKSKVSDFQWDPFDEETLAVACDDGIVKIWKIGENGLDRWLEEPTIELRGHVERLYCIKYHPYVRNVIATASYDRTIKLWNVETRQAVRTLRGHSDVIFSISWSPCGNKLATICKDGFIRIYEPLLNDLPLLEVKCGPGPGSKAARIEWVLNGLGLLVSGFGKGNLRQIYLLDSQNLNLLQTEDINQSPSLLIPYYDSDINVLYLYAKGEETVYLYEILNSEPYFQVLTPYKPEGLHFAIAFLNKIHCDVKSAEIAKAYRLTKDNRVEKISFTVPRVKLGFFQDDIFPDTVDLHSSYLSAQDWFNGTTIQLKFINLQPDNMKKLTEMQAIEQAQQPPKPVKKVPPITSTAGDLYNPDNLNDDEKKIINSMLQRATLYYKEKSDEENSEWD